MHDRYLPTILLRAVRIIFKRTRDRIRYWLLWLVMTTVCGGNSATMNILSLVVHDRHIGDAEVARLAGALRPEPCVLLCVAAFTKCHSATSHVHMVCVCGLFAGSGLL
eukprot:COSAG05_NODE_818_length_7136_cov_1156.705841_3_plen_108_part_00